MKKILVVGLNPSWQKTLRFKKFNYGEVNRAYSQESTASGKGINFAQAANIWGSNCTIYQFLGGQNGIQIEKELKARTLQSENQFVEQNTRICTTCLCEHSGIMTEIIEPSNFIDKKSENLLLEKIKINMKDYDAVAINGTYPDGVSPEFYQEVAMCAKKLNKVLLVDSWKGIEATLKTGAISILKINKDELLNLTTAQVAKEAILELYNTFKIENIIISDQGNSAFLYNGNDFIEAKPPKIKMINPIGAGDTVSGVILSEYLNSKDIESAFRLGVQAGSLSCENAQIAFYDKNDMICS